MSKRTLNKTLTDAGGKVYNLVRPGKDLGDGREDLPLYDSVPPDPTYQFTPDLGYCMGQTETPMMQKIQR